VTDYILEGENGDEKSCRTVIGRLRKELAMKDLNYMAIAEDAIKRIKQGAFLTVKAGDRLNVMTIGWAAFGVCWQRPIMMVAVRSSRHTFGIIEAAADFTVTVPTGGMEKELALCGSKSGSAMDKFKAAGLETIKAMKVASPIIKARGYQYECRIVYKTAMNPAYLDKDYDSSLYPKKDYHTLYFGEIVACYAID
jgi:flavin reductase (DIM6/NTAB) family NADH-FMN oxidoreductase RutF